MNVFSQLVEHGVVIGAQKDFARNINIALQILENIEGIAGIKIDKDGVDWKISLTGEGSTDDEGIPAGYEEETVNIVTDVGIKTRTVLVKSDTKANVATWNANQYRWILQVGPSGTLIVDYGRVIN